MPSNLPSPSLPISSGAWAYPGMLGIYLLAALSTLLMFGGNTTFSFLWLAGGPAVALILFRGTRLLSTVTARDGICCLDGQAA